MNNEFRKYNKFTNTPSGYVCVCSVELNYRRRTAKLGLVIVALKALY